MSLDRFQLFVSAAKHGSFTQASREHRISQPAVSRQLKLLQQDFGITFFKKTGRGVELTDSGRAFLKDVTTILSQVEQLKKKHRCKESESVIIAATRGPSASLLPSLMERFKETWPNVSLGLYPGNSREITEWLEASMVDLGIVTTRPTSSSFQTELYRSEQLITFVAPTHPIATGKFESLVPINIPLIVRGGHRNQTRMEQEMQSLQEKGIKLTIAMRCGSTRAIKEAVAHGAGVGILYHDAVKREIDSGEFKTVTIPGLDLGRQSYIVYVKKKPLSALAREFLSFLRASIREGSSIQAATPRIPNKTRGAQADEHIPLSHLRQ